MKNRLSKLRLVAAGIGLAMALGGAAGTVAAQGGPAGHTVVSAAGAGLEDWNSTGS